MGVNPDNPCPVCGNTYSEYHGSGIFSCRGCKNIYDGNSKIWENTGDHYDKQLCRDADTQSHDIIHIQKVLDSAGVSDPVKRQKIIEGITWKR